MAGRKRDAKLDEAILVGAAAVLAECGYRAFSVEAVAGRLEIPKSTVYTRWRSRSELLAGVLSRRMALMHDMGPDGVGDLRQALIDRLAEDIALARTQQGLAIAQAVLASREREDTHLDELVRMSDRRRAGYRLLFQLAVERGELPENADLELLVDLLLGAVWAAVLGGQPRNETDAPRLVAAVLATIPLGGTD